MITLDEELENIKNDTTKIGTKPPRIQTLSDVKNSTYGTDSEVKQLISDVESDISNVLGSAVFERGVQNLKKLPEQLQIYGGQALMSLGGFVDSDKTVSMGKELIKSARGELQADEKKFWESSTPLSEKDMESFTYGLGLGIANYGSMLAIGYLNPIAGITLGSAVEIGQQAEEKIGYHIEETGDTELNKYTSQKAQKDTLYTTIYGVGSAIIEKKFGLGKQLKLVKMPITSKLKHVIETAVSEGGTETLQELYATGLDWQGGYIDSSKLPERFMDALKEGVIGAVLGGGLGVASAVNHRSQAKAILRDSLKNTVPEKDLDNVVDGIYESANDSMSTVVAQELIQSESLRNKHGAIYESIKSEVSKQIKDTGAFADVDEMKLSQYIESTAKMFADQVLGEANKRKVVIDDILKDSEIIYKDGRLYLQGKIEKPKVIRKPRQYNPERMELLTYLKYKGGLKDVGGELKSMDAGRQIIGLINNKNGRSLDDAMLDAWESGYFPQFSERPTVNDLLDAIDNSLRGNKIYRESFRSTIEQRQAKEKEIENEEQLNMFLSDFISEEDLDTMSLQDKQRFYDDINEQANAVSEDDYIQQEINSLTDDEVERYAIMTENGATHDEAMQEIESNRTVDEDIPLFFQESFDIADENARLDDIYPEYKGETININGQEKTVYNSNGDRIAMSEPALRNFYNWFGDSKVVDEQGRPLVVYHGTSAEFDTFRKGNIFTTDNQEVASEYGSLGAMPLYMKLENPFIVDAYGQSFGEIYNAEGMKKAYKDLTEEDYKKLADTFFDGDIKEAKEWYPQNEQGEVNLARAYGEKPRATNEWADYARKEGYDGVIIKDVNDTVDISNIRTTDYVAFNPNQIKSTSNRGTYSESDNIYYQTGDGKDLVVSHATTLDKLEEALELGAMPMPSLAVTKAEYAGKSNFGEIVFVGGSDIVDPNRDVRNKTFTADIYSTRKVSPTFEITKDGVEYITRQTGNISKKGSYYWVTNISYDLERGSDNHLREIYLASKGKITDLDVSTYSIVQSMTEKENADFSVWKRKFINEYTDKKIFEGFTPSGNRKFAPYDLKNILRIMQKQNLKGSESTSGGNAHALRGIWAKELKSIEEIRKEKGRIVDEQIYQEMDNVIWDETTKLSDLLVSVKKAEELEASWIAPDEYMINEALSLIKPSSNIQKILEKADLRSDKKAVDAVKRYIKLVNDLPVKYFESKPQRAVDFSEFKGVIMPESSEYDNVARELEDRGLLVLRTPNYIDAMSEFEDIFFQITNLPKQKKKIKGAFDKLTKSIKITSEADFSTYQHEFAHFWLDNIWNYANSGQASENYLKQFNEIKKWLGTKGNYPTRNQHEKFARAYEKYLYKSTNADAPIGQAFKDYENFIREVYSSIAEIDTRAGKKYKAIPKVVYDFFNSMTSGNLPYYGDIEEPEKEVKKEVKDVKEYVEEESKVLEENTRNYTLKPVQTDTQKGYLTAYEKMTGQQVEAGAVNLEDELKKAQKFVNENPEQAKRIVEGLEQAPEGMLKNTIYIAYNDLQKRLGNTQNRVTSLLNQAMELRRMGQEIVSQRIAYADDTSPLYWIRTVQQNKLESLADSNGLSVKEVNDKISNSIKTGVKEGKTAKEIAKELRAELGVTELFQEEVYPTEDTDIKAYNYVYKYVNDQLGLGMTMEEAETITRKADDMLASLENSMSKTGNPSVDFFVKQKDLENYANSLAPSSNARVIVSVVGRGNLLTSIKSPLTNIISNFFVGAYRGAVRRVNLGVANSIVSPELIRENKMYSWEIFRKTGYNVNNITPETPRNTILGEKLTHSEGEGNIRKLGRLYEEYIYKWSLGAGDVVFKDYAFTDYVALKATKLANGDVSKANALFKDASLIEPQTEEGKQIRQEAIDESLIATFQNKGAISEGALKARASIDFGVGFGEIIAPFVKTPANIVSMGLKAGFGGVRAIASEIKRDVKAGKILKPTQENIDLVVQNGLGLLLASILINAIDDDDYMPPYALATSKDKQLAKELNIPFNAVKIGNTWVSLDYLGALASPLVGLLQARREEGFLNKIYGYSKSAGVQALSIPAFGNISDLFEKVQNLVRKSGDEVMSETGQDLLEQVYARVVPSIVSDVAKALDPYERETQGNEFITKIPVLRETAPKKVSVTSGVAEELGSPVYDILFGSRVKEQVTNDVADELQRLNNTGYGVGLTTVTRSGLLSSLDDDTKQKVREDFAEEYSKQVKRLIKTSRYKRLSDEDKMESVNKIRRSIIDRLKKRYLKKRK